MPLNRHLNHAEALLPRDGEHFHVERPAVDAHQGEDDRHGLRREHLEPALRILDPRERETLHHEVEEASRQMAVRGFTYAPGEPSFTAADCEVEAIGQRRQEPADFFHRHRQVGVTDEPVLAWRRGQSGLHRPALAPVRLALHDHSRLGRRERPGHARGVVSRSIVDNADLPVPGLPAKVLA
jgi:hypothetical protein